MTNNKLSSAAEKLIADREVDPATVKQYLTVQTEGKRKVEHQFGYYRSFAKDGETDNSVIKKYLITVSDDKAGVEASSQDEATIRKNWIVQQEGDRQASEYV